MSPFSFLYFEHIALKESFQRMSTDQEIVELTEQGMDEFGSSFNSLTSSET